MELVLGMELGCAAWVGPAESLGISLGMELGDVPLVVLVSPPAVDWVGAATG